MDKRIRELRTYLGLSQKNFGEAIGYTGTYIFRIEKQAANPSDQFIQKVCEAFHVNPGYFTDEMPVDQAVQKVEVDTAGAGQRLTNAREQKGLSMWELSRRTGISQPQISMLESGKNRLKRKSGEKLAAVLEVGVDWLLTGDERKRHFPADKKLIDWLWEHPVVREELWKRMKEKEVEWSGVGEKRRK